MEQTTRQRPDAPTPEQSAAAEGRRRGAQKGGVERAKKLSPLRRREIARAAAFKRWRGVKL